MLSVRMQVIVFSMMAGVSTVASLAFISRARAMDSRAVNTSDTQNIGTAEDQLTCEEARFIWLINSYRSHQSDPLPTLKVSKALNNASKWHAKDMAERGYFAHIAPDGKSPFERMKEFGYTYNTWKAENIAAGKADAINTFCMWKTSSGHNVNMLNPRFAVIGIGTYYEPLSEYRHYWNTTFGGFEDELMSEPLFNDANCSMPTALPNC